MFAMEKLIPLLLSGLGLDPDVTKAQLAALQNWVVTSIKNLDSRMRAVESDRSAMHAKLDAIIIHLGANHVGNSNAVSALGIDHVAANDDNALGIDHDAANDDNALGIDRDAANDDNAHR